MCHIAEAILDVLRSVFWNHIISRKADVIWPLQSCDLTPLSYYLRRAVEDKCYDNKLETIDTLKLHTIDNVLKNWNDCVGFCMTSRMKLFSIINRKDGTFK